MMTISTTHTTTIDKARTEWAEVQRVMIADYAATARVNNNGLAPTCQRCDDQAEEIIITRFGTEAVCYACGFSLRANGLAPDTREEWTGETQARRTAYYHADARDRKHSARFVPVPDDDGPDLPF